MKESNSHIDELIVKSLLGDNIPAEEQELAEWAKSSDSNTAYLRDIKKVWLASEGLDVYNSVDVEGDFEVFKSKVGLNSTPVFIKGLSRSFMKVAAVMIPLILFFAAYSLYQTTPGFGKWQAFKSSDKIDKVILSDNSEVSLNKNSKLVFEKTFDGKQRTIRLHGEGYFKVTKNPLKPFVVNVGDAKVRVLGTAFNLDENQNTGDVTLSVTEGRVLFSSGNENVEVVAGEKAICVDGKIQKQTLNSNNCIAWMTGSIDFDKATLDEVLETIEDHFNEVRIIENKSSKTEYLITSKFENPSLEDVLVELRIHFEKKFEINGNKLIISD